MAHQLNVNQSTYAKMENSSTKITIDKLFSVAKLLEADVSEILDLKSNNFNQTDNETANAFGKVEHYYQENKEGLPRVTKSQRRTNSIAKEMLDKNKRCTYTRQLPKIHFFSNL